MTIRATCSSTSTRSASDDRSEPPLKTLIASARVAYDAA